MSEREKNLVLVGVPLSLDKYRSESVCSSSISDGHCFQFFFSSVPRRYMTISLGAGHQRPCSCLFFFKRRKFNQPSGHFRIESPPEEAKWRPIEKAKQKLADNLARMFLCVGWHWKQRSWSGRTGCRWEEVESFWAVGSVTLAV